jgi:hypothetical protein
MLLFAPLVLGALLVFLPRRGTTGGSSRELPAIAVPESASLDGEELLFLLQYVGSDYPGAVADGRILDEFEYQEMSQFSRILVEEHARIAPEGSEVREGLSRLATRTKQIRRCSSTRELVWDDASSDSPSRARRKIEEEALRLRPQCHGAGGDAWDSATARCRPARSVKPG